MSLSILSFNPFYCGILSVCTSQKIARRLFMTWRIYTEFHISQLAQSVRWHRPTHRQLKVSALSRSIKSLSAATLDGSIRAKAWRCNLTDGIVLSHRRWNQWKFFFFVWRCFYLRNSSGGSPCTDSCSSQPVDDIPESSRQQSAQFVERIDFTSRHRSSASLWRSRFDFLIPRRNRSKCWTKCCPSSRIGPNAIKRQIFSGEFQSNTKSIEWRNKSCSVACFKKWRKN